MFLALAAVALACTPSVADSSSQGGVAYRLTDGRFLRVERGVARELAYTLEGGSGVVHAFDESPLGTVFVAAERGLFVTSRDVTSLDPVERWQGAPSGAPVGVVVDSNERVWLATRDAFGPVELHQSFGHTFDASDGAPAPPYTSLERGADGELVLGTARGEWRYRPGQTPGPTVAVLALDGVPWARVHSAGGALRTRGGAVEVELAGSGLGALTFRWRDARSPNWRLLAGARATLSGLEPGRHVVLFSAWDRELRTAVSAPVTLEVPYPRVFARRTLVPLALGIAATVVALFVGRAWRRRSAGGVRRAAVSSVLALALAGQLVAASFPHARGWPFVGFGMYTEVAEPFSVAYRDVLIGIGADGRTFEIDLWTAGFGQYVLRRRLVPAMLGSDADRRALLDELNRERFGGALRGFAIRCVRQRLTASGPIEVAPVEYVRYVPEEVAGAAR